MVEPRVLCREVSFTFSCYAPKSLPVILVPPPYVSLSSSHPPPYYDGTSLRLSCSVTLDPSVDSNEIISVSWSGLSHIQQGRYSVVHSTSARSHSSSLTISPLADKDDGTITCTGTVTGGNSAQSASSSDDIIINVKGMGNRKAFCMRISLFLQLYLLHHQNLGLW